MKKIKSSSNKIVKKKTARYTKGSSNVFQDLRIKDPEEHLARAKLGHSVRVLLEERKLSQKDASKVLGIKQPEVSNIMNGKYNVFTQDRLYSFLSKQGDATLLP